MANVKFLSTGSRTLIAGKTGSGKSTGAVYMLRQSRQKWLLIDPKRDDKIATLKPAYISKLDTKEVERAWRAGYQYVALNPPPLATPQDVDLFLLDCFQTFQNFGIYVDELYYIHSNGRAGAGLQAILTRGRSDKITFCGATQRPAWISVFCLSEADYICQYRLQLEKDREKIYNVTAKLEMLENPPKEYSWFYYTAKTEKLQLFVPPVRA
jgi:hypothetical protein